MGQILENTQDSHADHSPLREALEQAEELCSQVNEGVREKENSDRLEWIQSHVQCEGPIEVNTIRQDSICCTPNQFHTHTHSNKGLTAPDSFLPFPPLDSHNFLSSLLSSSI